MTFFSDPTELSPAYRAVVADVDRAATAAASGARPGRDFRHAFGREKKRLLFTTHGIFWRTPAERRASRLRAARRAAVEGSVLLLAGGGLGLSLAWLVDTGRVSADAVGIFALIVGLPFLTWVVWVCVRAAQEPWDEWDVDPYGPTGA